MLATMKEVMKLSVHIGWKYSQTAVIKMNYGLLANPSSGLILVEMLGYH